MPPANSTSDDKLWGALSYLWILSIIILATKKNDDFVRFHASQGSLIFVVSFILMFIPMLGWMLNLVLGIVAIVGIIKALQGEKWPLPLGADVAKNFGDWIIKTFKL